MINIDKNENALKVAWGYAAIYYFEKIIFMINFYIKYNLNVIKIEK